MPLIPRRATGTARGRPGRCDAAASSCRLGLSPVVAGCRPVHPHRRPINTRTMHARRLMRGPRPVPIRFNHGLTSIDSFLSMRQGATRAPSVAPRTVVNRAPRVIRSGTRTHPVLVVRRSRWSALDARAEGAQRICSRAWSDHGLVPTQESAGSSPPSSIRSEAQTASDLNSGVSRGRRASGCRACDRCE